MYQLAANQSTGRRARVEMISCFFRELSTYLFSWISYVYVISAEVIMLMRIPSAGIRRTNKISSILIVPSRSLIESPPITSAAQVDYANEPNRSAPIPAMSPTLSPTLSAMVAGFLGLSSGNPDSIFPTRSEPKSAAFVKIPPPTLANNATVDPPSPNPATA